MTPINKLLVAGAVTMALGSTYAIAQSGTNQLEAGSQATQDARSDRLPATKAAFGKRRGKRGGRRAMMEVLRQADANNDRALTQTELDQFIEKTVSSADANSDGNVSLQEFQTIWMELTRRRMADAFQRLDADASGTITAEERTEMFGDVIARMDRNDDGKLDANDRRSRKDRGNRRRDGRGHQKHNR